MPSGTTIYYRGYAENTTGKGYSADGTFSTLAAIVNGVCAVPPDGFSYPNAASIPLPLCTQGTASPSSLSGAGPWAWQCLGSGSGTNDDCLATVGAPVPPALVATPVSIYTGNSTTLQWTSSASSCSGVNFTASGASGSAVVTPAVTTTYIIVCDGVEARATVTVKNRPIYREF